MRTLSLPNIYMHRRANASDRDVNSQLGMLPPLGYHNNGLSSANRRESGPLANNSVNAFDPNGH